METNRHGDKGRDRGTEKNKDRDKGRSTEKNRDTDKVRDRGTEKNRDRDKVRDRGTEENGDKDRGRERDRIRDRSVTLTAGSFPGVQHDFTHRGEVFLAYSSSHKAGSWVFSILIIKMLLYLYISTTNGINIHWLQIT